MENLRGGSQRPFERRTVDFALTPDVAQKVNSVAGFFESNVKLLGLYAQIRQILPPSRSKGQPYDSEWMNVVASLKPHERMALGKIIGSAGRAGVENVGEFRLRANNEELRSIRNIGSLSEAFIQDAFKEVFPEDIRFLITE